MQIDYSFPCNLTNYRARRNDSIKYIVIHYVGATGSARQNAQYYANTKSIGASAHYFVGKDSESGKIYASVPETSCAWHCGHDKGGKYYHAYCRNDNAIGIEMCCHKSLNGKWYFDKTTVDRTVELTKHLMSKYNIPVANVLRHFDVTGKTCPAPFVESNNAWENFKKGLISVKELESINDIVWELAHRGIVSDKDLWLKKLEEDKNSYWLARKLLNYIISKGV